MRKLLHAVECRSEQGDIKTLRAGTRIESIEQQSDRAWLHVDGERFFVKSLDTVAFADDAPAAAPSRARAATSDEKPPKPKRSRSRKKTAAAGA